MMKLLMMCFAAVQFQNVGEIDGELVQFDGGVHAEDGPVHVAPIPHPLPVYECIFTCTLTNAQATRSQLVSFHY